MKRCCKYWEELFHGKSDAYRILHSGFIELNKSEIKISYQYYN